MTSISQPVKDLVDVLAAMRGTVAVVLGGSRAVRSDDTESDWDLGVYRLLEWVDRVSNFLGEKTSEAKVWKR
jgi:predicted nucleotidyltransferase